MLPKKAVNSLPDKPGVYFFKDRSLKILYIGKAKSLKNRVKSYTYKHYKHSKRTRKLMRYTKSLDYAICGSELEALLLESRQIKEYQPEYNILQRRFRRCPFIKITMNERFPRIFVTWDVEIDGAKYLGPYSNREQAEGTVDVIHKLFPIRYCEGDIAPRKRRPACLKYDVKKCSGPCLGKITSKDYRKIFNTIITLLSGKKEKIISNMEKQMRKESDALNFEKAQVIRDRINLIRESIFRRQYQVNAVDNNNLIAIYPAKDVGYAEIFFIRKGGLAGQKTVSLLESNLTQMMASDIENIFFQPDRNGNKTVSKYEIDAMNIISRWLYRHRNDQSFVHIKRKRNKAETINKAVNEIKKVIDSLNQNENKETSIEWDQEDS
jgi:excinuclease UvrABC nuclease subunit